MMHPSSRAWIIKQVQQTKGLHIHTFLSCHHNSHTILQTVFVNNKIGPNVFFKFGHFVSKAKRFVVSEWQDRGYLAQGCIVAAGRNSDQTQDISPGSPPQVYPDPYLRNIPLHHVPGNLVTPTPQQSWTNDSINNGEGTWRRTR